MTSNNTTATTTANVAARFPSLDMTGILVSTEGTGNNWGWTVLDASGIRVNGVADTLSSAVHKAAASTRAIREFEGGVATAIVQPAV
jgi:hypothetical protein